MSFRAFRQPSTSAHPRSLAFAVSTPRSLARSLALSLPLSVSHCAKFFFPLFKFSWWVHPKVLLHHNVRQQGRGASNRPDQTRLTRPGSLVSTADVRFAFFVYTMNVYTVCTILEVDHCSSDYCISTSWIDFMVIFVKMRQFAVLYCHWFYIQMVISVQHLVNLVN